MFYERKISASMMERKALECALQLKSLDDVGAFEGYGSVFDVVDSQRDVVARGAFRESLQTSRPQDIKLLWQHQMDEPIGVIEQCFEDARGLVVKGRLLLEVAKAREAYTLLKNKAVTGLSIGYAPSRYSINPDTRVRTITALKLFEISLVTFPSNPQAQVTTVKSHREDAPLSPALVHEIARMQRLMQETIGGCR